MAQAILFLVGSGYNVVLLKYLRATLSSVHVVSPEEVFMEQFGHWIYGVHVKQDLMLVHCMLKITEANSAIVFYQAQLQRKWSKNRGRKSMIL